VQQNISKRHPPMTPKKDRKGRARRAPEPSDDDNNGWANHDNVPKDAKGVPVFFILPDGVRASYERKLRSSKRAWLATGDPGALRKAAYDIKYHRQPEPDWYFDAIVTLLTGMRSDDDVQRAQRNAVHSQRYQIVRDILADNAADPEMSVDDACEHAANRFAAYGSWQDFKRSYYKVKKALKQGYGAAFNIIHVPKSQPR
jgi:hypothetical protein